jgi:CheY-like chemotaxis protein
MSRQADLCYDLGRLECPGEPIATADARPSIETILLVDDEADVVATAREMLEDAGYQILGALNAEDAVRIAIGHTGPIHLLLTDVAMPGTSGQALAQQLTIQRPTIKVLFMSTFALTKGQQQFADVGSGLDLGAPVILKPFTSGRLTEKIREVLASKPASPFDRPADPWRNV